MFDWLKNIYYSIRHRNMPNCYQCDKKATGFVMFSYMDKEQPICEDHL